MINDPDRLASEGDDFIAEENRKKEEEKREEKEAQEHGYDSWEEYRWEEYGEPPPEDFEG